jgi:hypothetical protein
VCTEVVIHSQKIRREGNNLENGIMTAPGSGKMYMAGREESVKELIRDLKDNLMPETAAITWPLWEFLGNHRFDLDSSDGDGDFRQALTQNTSLKELLLSSPTHHFEYGEIIPELTFCEDDPGEAEAMVNQFSSELEEYHKSLQEVRGILTALPANVKVLSIANWIPDWVQMPTCHEVNVAWLAHVQVLARVLEINPALETLDLRTRDQNAFWEDKQTGKIGCHWPCPTSSRSSFDAPGSDSDDDMTCYGYGLGYDMYTRDTEMRGYIDMMRLGAPIIIGNAIRERCFKGIYTELKGVPLSYAKEELGITLSLSSSDGGSHDEYNRVCIEGWLQEGRERHVALGMGLLERLGEPTDSGTMRTRAATKKGRGCPFYGIGPDVFRLICGR